tara:strand:- start:681 stop:1940 length:1260 start_codon:yes stop_codon:yes gene_type:complete
MTFNKLKKKMEEEFGTSKLSDIAKELNVSPQVVSNWKARNQVPYKYVRQLRKKISRKGSKQFGASDSGFINLASEDQSRIVRSFDEKPFELFEELFFKLYNLIIENASLVFGLPFIMLIWAIISLKFFVSPTYISEAKILPISSESSVSGVMGLASEFGLNLGASETTGLSESKMVPYLIRSRRMARNLLDNKFSTDVMGENKKLIAIIFSDSITQKFSENKISKAINKLSRMIKIKGGDFGDPLISLSIKSSEPKLSAQICDSLIWNLGKLMNEYKLKRIVEKKSFIETRLLEVNLKLKKAEDDLRDFRSQNRSIYSSPALMLEQSRLVRDLEMYTQLHLTLVTQSEMIKIEEIGKTDMLQVLDPPEVPIKRTSPVVNTYILVRVITGLLISFFILFMKGWIVKNKQKILKPLMKITN